ncbi:hypothetical protein ACI65C_010113 [Semiaphis heraclei]
MLATSCLVLVSANPGSYNYAYNLNEPITGDLQEQRDAKDCNDDMQTVVASKSYVSEPIIASVTSRPILNAEFVSSTPASILHSDFESSRIIAATPQLETKIESEPLVYAPLPKYASPKTVISAPIMETKTAAEPLVYAPRPEYAPLPKYSAPITVTAAPMLETRIAAEPLVYASRPEYAPLPKYSAPIMETKIAAEPLVYAPLPKYSAPIMETKIAAEPLVYAPLPKYSAPITVTAAPMLEKRIAAEPLVYAPRPEYAPLPKYSAPITATAAPMLETRIAAEPLVYAPRPEYAPLLKYATRPEYIAASPAPLVASRLQAPIVHVQAAPSKIIKSAQLQSYGRKSASYSHKSFVNHPPTPVRVAPIAPQYYSAAPAAPAYYSPAPAAPEYYAPAPAAADCYAPAPVAPIAMKLAQPVARANYAPVLLQQAAGLEYAPSAQYAYRSSSSPATSYQYAKHWDVPSGTSQSRYIAASPQYYSTVYQPQLDSAPVTQIQNLGQYDAQEQPCEK